MSSHPLNLAVRFILELLMLLALGYWGAQQGEGITSAALAAGIPLVAAAAWGIFAVPDDPSRSGKAPVPVPGIARLLLELGLFALAALALLVAGWTVPAVVFTLVVVIHYALSYDRILWLLEQ